MDTVKRYDLMIFVQLFILKGKTTDNTFIYCHQTYSPIEVYVRPKYLSVSFVSIGHSTAVLIAENLDLSISISIVSYFFMYKSIGVWLSRLKILVTNIHVKIQCMILYQHNVLK